MIETQSSWANDHTWKTCLKKIDDLDGIVSELAERYAVGSGPSA